MVWPVTSALYKTEARGSQIPVSNSARPYLKVKNKKTLGYKESYIQSPVTHT